MVEDFINSQAYVDLGLPSGNLWATCDVGAHKPWECGKYFSHEQLTELGLINGGTNDNLFLPNNTDFQELWNNTSHKSYWSYRQNGLLLTSLINGKSIFIPSFGFKTVTHSDESPSNLQIVYLFTSTTRVTSKTTFIFNPQNQLNYKDIRLAGHSSDYYQHIRLIKKR